MRVRGGDVGWHRGFGVVFSCDFPLPGLPACPPQESRHLAARLASADEVADAWSGPAQGTPAAHLVIDGLPYRAERGAAGDHRFLYGDRAAFHLSPDAGTLRCAPARESDPAWRRVLLDSVLATVSLLQGFEALHAAAVAGPGGVVAFIARTGGGKTTLAVELLRRGLALMADDVLALSRIDGRVVAHPAPPVMNLPAAAPAPRGMALAALEDETWLAVEQAAESPAPVAAVFVVDRRPGVVARVLRRDGGVIDLVAHALRSGSEPARLQARFELLSDLAEQAPGFLLEADPATPPDRLADLAEQACPELMRVPAEAFL